MRMCIQKRSPAVRFADKSLRYLEPIRREPRKGLVVLGPAAVVSATSSPSQRGIVRQVKGCRGDRPVASTDSLTRAHSARTPPRPFSTPALDAPDVPGGTGSPLRPASTRRGPGKFQRPSARPHTLWSGRSQGRRDRPVIGGHGVGATRGYEPQGLRPKAHVTAAGASPPTPGWPTANADSLPM